MHGRQVLAGVALVGICAWCGWVSGDHRRTTAAEITWLVSLAAVLLFDMMLWRGKTLRRWGLHLRSAQHPWPREGQGGAGRAFRGVAPWLALLAVAVTWDVLGIDTGPRQYHLTISALAQAYRPLNAALLLVWILVGIGYGMARAREPVDGDHTRPRRGGVRTSPNKGAFTAAAGSLGPVHGAPALLLPQSPPVGVAFWVAVPVIFALIDIGARGSNGRRATAEEFIRFISRAWWANLALIAAWVVAGFHLFAR